MSSLFLINRVDSRQLLNIFKLLPLVTLTRIRLTCRGLLQFIDDNIEELQPKTSHFLRISVNSACPQEYTFVVIPLDDFQLDDSDIYRPTSRNILINSFNQIRRVSFEKIILILFKKRKETSCPPNLELSLLLQSLDLSCSSLEVQGELKNKTNLSNYLSQIAFKKLSQASLYYEDVLSYSKRCEEISVQSLNQLDLVDYGDLHRFRIARFGRVDNVSEDVLLKNFENYLLKIKKTHSTGRLRSLTLPSLNLYLGYVPPLNWRRLGLIEVFDGGREDLWSDNGIFIKMYLMRLSVFEVAVICATESGSFTMEVVEDKLEEIVDAMASRLYHNFFYYTKKHPILMERLVGKQWTEFKEIVTDYRTEFKGECI